MYKNILLHIPHDHVGMPRYFGNICLNRHYRLPKFAEYLIDHYTVDLFSSSDGNPLVHYLTAPYNRILVDMERIPNDPLEANGFGIVSQWAIDQYGDSIREEAMRLYEKHHSKGARQLNGLKSPLLLDCHSFSSFPTQLCTCPPDVDICLGWNEDETKPYAIVIEFAKLFFEKHGYKVGCNTPFSNSKTFPGATDYHSLMIEVNKRCYMDEEEREKHAGFNKLHEELNEFYTILLE